MYIWCPSWWTTLDKSCQDCGSDGAVHLEHYSPFSFHEELAYRIKASLTAGTKEDVDVKIELPFDPLEGCNDKVGLFADGEALISMKLRGTPNSVHYLVSSGISEFLMNRWTSATST